MNDAITKTSTQNSESPKHTHNKLYIIHVKVKLKVEKNNSLEISTYDTTQCLNLQFLIYLAHPWLHFKLNPKALQYAQIRTFLLLASNHSPMKHTQIFYYFNYGATIPSSN